MEQPDLFQIAAAQRAVAHLPGELVAILDALADSWGQANAVQAADLAARAGILPDASRETRRTRVRTILMEHYHELPWPVVADSAGFYRPATPEEVQHYAANLISRTDGILLRLQHYCQHLQTTPHRLRVPNPNAIQSLRQHLTAI